MKINQILSEGKNFLKDWGNAEPAEFAAFVANLSVFVLGHGFMLAAGAEGLRRRLPRARFIVASMPLYWLMISAAAWLALWQFATNPFHWNKTPHKGMRAGKA